MPKIIKLMPGIDRAAYTFFLEEKYKEKNRNIVTSDPNLPDLFDSSTLTPSSVATMIRNKVIYAVFQKNKIIGSVEISKDDPPKILDMYVLEEYWSSNSKEVTMNNLTALLYTTAEKHINPK